MSVCQVPSRVKDASDIFAFCVYPVGDLAHAHEKSISATDLQDIYTPKGLAKRAERLRLQDCKGMVRVGDVYDEATVERALPACQFCGQAVRSLDVKSRAKTRRNPCL